MFKIFVDSNYKFVVEQNEISEIKWFSREEINESFISNLEMFTPNFPDYYKKFLEYENQN
jgi:isopentenyldiphosphate isomerase